MIDFSNMPPYELGLTCREDVIPFLINFLKKGSANERRLAASAVGKLATHFKDACNQAIPALLSCLELSDQPQTRQYALKTLSKLDLPIESLHIIRKIQESDQKQYNRDAATAVLSKFPMDNSSTLKTIVNTITDGSNLDDEVLHESVDFSFRIKYPPILRTIDGHMVRSRAELLIDNWLYYSGIIHAYEKQVPVKEDLFCDFYLPKGDVYMEYWGLEKNENYQKRKEIKRQIYSKYNLNLIELTDEHIKYLDDCLPKFLLKYDISVL
ncbi:hypothetical protein L0337_34715 [candidate division KSB1 bacterium]|nr:hypothetical protein [candidate division KSB1 bacterium]